jgi:hypothetical protein
MIESAATPEEVNARFAAAHAERGYTIGVYLPPQAPWEAVEATLDAIADHVHSLPGDDWDGFVVGLAGDILGIDGEPEFPLPIRPDGTHHYVSTYCVHGDHAACRRVCKSCPAECACDCGHPKPAKAAPAPDPAAIVNRIRQVWHGRRARPEIDAEHLARIQQVVDGERQPSTLDLALVAILGNRSVEWLASGEQLPEEAMGKFRVRSGWDAPGGVATPGCDCGHDGMGVSWHARDCAWWVAQPVDNPVVLSGHRQCRACDHTITPNGTCANGCAGEGPR